MNVKFVRLVCLSFCLFVCPYVHYTKIYKNSSNLRIPLVVDSSIYGAFGELLCMPMFNKHVVTNKNKQVLILRKQVDHIETLSAC